MSATVIKRTEKDAASAPAPAAAAAPSVREILMRHKCWILAAIALILSVFLIVAWWKIASVPVPVSAQKMVGGAGRRRGGAASGWGARGGCGCVLP